ncbi:MAG: hypothetical protein U0R69_14085 [Gaiellales bacterium]
MEGDVARRQAITTQLSLRPQDEVECRRCRVHCDKVVYPSACLERSCPFVYAYEEWGHTYVGCMQRIYDVEIDLEVLSQSRGRRDGFGAVRARRQPLPMCRGEVVRCYQPREDELGCLNPEFCELSRGRPSFRVLSQLDTVG